MHHTSLHNIVLRNRCHTYHHGHTHLPTDPPACLQANGTLQGGGDSVADSLWSVERRLEAVESVVRYLDSKEAGGDLSYEEYEV